MNIRVENWNGHSIRFVEKEHGDWWAVLKDISEALKLPSHKLSQRLAKGVLSKYTLVTAGGPQEMLIVSEFGIYEAVFESRKKEAREFKRWVYQMIQLLRKASSLEGFQIFHMLDKEHQREAMARLKYGLGQPIQVDFIKANTIANKAVSSMFGYPRMLKKDYMPPDMLMKRQQILDDTVELMTVAEKFCLSPSISKAVYDKYLPAGGVH